MVENKNSSYSADDISRIVMLAYGAMEHGGPYWCYVSVKPGRYEEFQKAMASKKYNIQGFENDGYGEVIVSGEGVMPPEDVTVKVAEMFNVPVSKLFQEADPMKLISDKMKELKKS